MIDWGFSQGWLVDVIMDINYLWEDHLQHQCTTSHRIRKKTNDYKKKMECFDRHLTNHIIARDKENDITDVLYWNQLSIDENDPKFDEYFKKVISDNGVPEANNNNSVNKPEIFDSYINM